jgi:phage tail P2-like protein
MTDDLAKPSLLPPPLATDLSMRALEAVHSRLSDIDLLPTLIYDFEHVVSSALPHLGEQFHVMGAEGWRLATTEAQRRELLARAVALHRHKGTPWAIREALKAVGFNDIEINERLPSNRYDGSLAFSGSDVYAAYGWAQFRIVADAGDDQPITAEQTALLVEAVTAWKPARSHLVDVQHRASATDHIDVSEVEQHAAAMTHEDRHLWGHHFYDGSLNFNEGALHAFDGALHYDGAARLNGFSALPTGARYDGDREADSMAAQIVISDQQMRCPAFDAQLDYSGYADFGASAPVAEDLPMPIVVTRHRNYDGRMAFGLHRYDGAAHYTAPFTYFGNTAYSGYAITMLEA